MNSRLISKWCLLQWQHLIAMRHDSDELKADTEVSLGGVYNRSAEWSCAGMRLG